MQRSIIQQTWLLSWISSLLHGCRCMFASAHQVLFKQQSQLSCCGSCGRTSTWFWPSIPSNQPSLYAPDIYRVSLQSAQHRPVTHLHSLLSLPEESCLINQLLGSHNPCLHSSSQNVWNASAIRLPSDPPPWQCRMTSHEPAVSAHRTVVLRGAHTRLFLLPITSCGYCN